MSANGKQSLSIIGFLQITLAIYVTQELTISDGVH
jgi:hypothetical protein